MVLQNDRTPVAVVDIGSNSVRLIVYEDSGRAPAPVFNEKVLCGLGRSIATTGKLAPDAIKRALRALRRFRALIDQLGVTHVEVIATAAAREASNGAEFIAQAERAKQQHSQQATLPPAPHADLPVPHHRLERAEETQLHAPTIAIEAKII